MIGQLQSNAWVQAAGSPTLRKPRRVGHPHFRDDREDKGWATRPAISTIMSSEPESNRSDTRLRILLFFLVIMGLTVDLIPARSKLTFDLLMACYVVAVGATLPRRISRAYTCLGVVVISVRTASAFLGADYGVIRFVLYCLVIIQCGAAVWMGWLT
jgi:hypothetical protein